MASSGIANLLATRVESLVWVLAVEHDHDTGKIPISGDLLNRSFKPVFTELTEIQHKIDKLRSFCNARSVQAHGPAHNEPSEFMGLDFIPREMSDTTAETLSRTLNEDVVPKSILPQEASPLNWQPDAVPSEYTSGLFFDRMSTLVGQAEPKKPINDMEVPDDIENLVCEEDIREAETHDVTEKEEDEQDATVAPKADDSRVRYSQYTDDDDWASTSSRRPKVAVSQSNDSGEITRFSSAASMSHTSLASHVADTFHVLDVWRRSTESALPRGTIRSHPALGASNSIDDILAHEKTDTMDSMSVTSRCSCLQLEVPLHPGSPYRSAWDVLSALFVINDVIVVPMEFLSLPDYTFFKVTGWMVRLFWTVDLFLNFFSGYFNDNGLAELRLREVLKRYLSTWMLPDLTLVLFDWAEVAIEQSESETGVVRMSKSSRVLRMLRAARLLRMGKAMKLLTDLGFFLTSDKTNVVIDIVKIIFLIIAFTHVIACLWVGLGSWESEYGFQTWLYVADMQDDSIGNNYLVSCIWALSLFSGGTDFPLPQNVAERMFMSILLLVCFVSAAGFVSLLTSATTKLLLMTSGTSKQLGKLRTYLTQNHVSMRLISRIQKSARRVVFEKQGKIHEGDVDLLRSICEPLRTELAMEIRGPTLTRHPFFECYSQYYPTGMRKLAAGAAASMSVMSDDILFMMGERQIEPCMYFVDSGELSYRQERGSKDLVSDGSWIAEAVLWTDWMHQGTLVATSACEVVSVVAKQFHIIVKMFSNSQEAAAAYAEEFVEHLNSLNQWQLSDLEWDQDRVFDFQTFFQLSVVRDFQSARRSRLSFGRLTASLNTSRIN